MRYAVYYVICLKKKIAWCEVKYHWKDFSINECREAFLRDIRRNPNLNVFLSEKFYLYRSIIDASNSGTARQIVENSLRNLSMEVVRKHGPLTD